MAKLLERLLGFLEEHIDDEYGNLPGYCTCAKPLRKTTTDRDLGDEVTYCRRCRLGVR